MPPKKKNNAKKVAQQMQQVLAFSRHLNQTKRPKARPRSSNHVSMRAGETKGGGAAVALSRGTTVITTASKPTTYSRREFVSELKTPIQPEGGPAKFSGNVTVANVNPGLQSIFPWLSTVANYEQYRFKRLAFTFQSSVPTSSPGQVVLVTNVDAKDSVMTSSVELMSYSGAATGRIWDSHTHRVPPQATTKKNYTRKGPIPASADLSLYDVGLFYVYVLGGDWGINLGTLWVDYEIEFFVPKVVLSVTPQFAYIRGDRKSVTAAEPFGEDSKLFAQVGNNLQWTCDGTDKPGWCQFKIDPAGNTQMNLTAFAPPVEAGGEFVDMEMFLDTTKVIFQNYSSSTNGEVIPISGGSGQAAILNLTAALQRPNELLDIYFRLPAGDIQNSAIVPNLIFNLWRNLS